MRARRQEPAVELPYTEEHHLFRASVRRFIEREVAPHHAQWEKDGVVSREVWRKAGDAGLLLTSLPADYGGGGADFLTSVIMIEEFSRGVFSGPGFRLHSDIVAPYVLNHGSEALKRRWRPRLARGGGGGALPTTEPAAGRGPPGL